MEINNILVAELKNNSVPESDRERPKLPKAPMEFMGVEGWVKRIFSENCFPSLGRQLYIFG